MDHTGFARLSSELVLLALIAQLAGQRHPLLPPIAPAASPWFSAGAAKASWCRLRVDTDNTYLEALNQAMWEADAQLVVPLDAAECRP